MVRESRYNYEFRGHDGHLYLCNGLSGTIIRKPSAELCSASAFSESDREFLQTNHFLVADDIDETKLVLERNRHTPGMNDRLELTIMLHENCNFRCTYCFEDFVNRKFAGKVLQDLVTFAQQTLPEGGTLVNHFYGGEPLLAWESLIEINQALEGIVGEKSGYYNFFITTNGSLLTADKVRYLAAHNALHVKVTLDGPPEVHDLRRKRANGRGTFAQILDNIVSALPFLAVKLRVNIDRDNVDDVIRLLDILAERCTSRENLYLDYNIVHDPCTGQLVDGVDYADLARLQTFTLDRGFKLSLPPLVRVRYCKFNSKNSYLVDTEGALYLCSKGPTTQVGQLSTLRGKNLPLTIRTQEQAENTRAIVSAFQEPKDVCLDCNLLPICGGGCTYLSFGGNGRLPCPPWKKDLETYLRLQLRQSYPV